MDKSGKKPMKPCGQIAIGVYALASVVFLATLYMAKTSGVSVRGRALLAEPWGYATLLDYVLSAYFALVYMTCRGAQNGTVWRGALWGVLTVFLGQIVAMVYMIVLNVQHGTLEDMVPLQSYPDAQNGREKRRNKWTWIIAAVAGVLAIYFYIATSRAIRAESLSQAWRNIKADPWLFLTFMDFCLGLIFVASYIMVSEGGGLTLLFWMPLLIFGGNGISMIYLITKLLNNVGRSPVEAILTTNVVS
mmetsp:Transcript_7382/g.22486  ORF Transcript_7382/g.22486 Transcript_7382/m.22486 type:complete len:247 (+) Transcript_7382:120-860(+)